MALVGIMAKKELTSNAGAAATKRQFLLKLWIGLGAVALAELFWVIISFLRPRRSIVRQSESTERIAVGRVEGFAVGTVTAFPRGHFYLARLEDGGFLALSRRCTHLGCTVPWVEEEKIFKCPCHSSTFDIRGAVIQSPAPRAMDLFAVSIENGVIFVDTRVAIKRSGADPGQVAYPKTI